MSRLRKKAGGRMRNGAPKSDLYDITLNDYANSSGVGVTSRLKKISLNKDKLLSLIEDNRSWDDELTNIEAVDDDLNHENSSGTKKNRKKKRHNPETMDDDFGYIYPQEIWFLISKHIRPEDVGRFAGICRACQAVVSTAEFWFSLYRRYYRKVADLPERLQPGSLVRRYGLRADVIRSLHYMYPPFVNKLKSHIIFDGDPHVLIKSTCILSWSEKKGQWLFYFKLKQSQVIKHGRGHNQYRKPGLLEMLEDITANPDDHCKMLLVTCLNYIPLPMICGQVLLGVSLTLSQDMRHHRLQLSFDCGPCPYMSNNLIILDPVLNVRVLDWWHPSFPHVNGINNTAYINESNDLFEEVEF